MKTISTPTPCPACGFAAPPGMRFCGACGQNLLAEQISPTRKSRRRTSPRTANGEAAERRQLTVMFCDLANSTRLSGKLDPEDLSRILVTYRDACVAVVERHQGIVTRFLGDGLLVFFGFPVAHEDDPQRAIRAALGIQQRMQQINIRLAASGDDPLAVRIGVHTGIVVVGDLGSENHVELQGVMGETPNIAARLQGLALQGQIVVSEETKTLANGFFRFEPRVPERVHGVERILSTYLVNEEVPLYERLNARRHQTPMVGHGKELSILLDAWRNAGERRGGERLIILEGEAGIGKSRLVQEFRNSVAIQGISTVSLQCAADSSGTAFYPVIQWITSELDLDIDTEPKGSRRLAGEALAARGLHNAASISAIAVLLGLADEREKAEAEANPRRQRRRLIDGLARLISVQPERGPALLLLEDAHWADDSTLTLVRACVERPDAAPTLIIITARYEVLPSIHLCRRVFVERLSESEARSLVRSMAGEAIAPGLLTKIVERTDGVPLFIEEVTWTATTRDARNAGTKRDRSEDIPMTLGHSLAARLDQLAGTRPVAQIASVIGRIFRVDFLEAVLSDRPSTAKINLVAALERLQTARVIEAVPGNSKGVFKFRHALIQEAAYGSLLRDRRRDSHRRIANLLSTRFGETPEARHETIARHCAAGGLILEAVERFSDAAREAARIAGNVEAIQHYQAALALLKQHQEFPDHDEREVALQIGLASQLVVSKGNAAPEVEQTLGRARYLADQLGDERLRFRTLRHLQTFHMVRGNIREAYGISSELRERALREGDPDILLQVHRPHGLCLLYLGRFEESREELHRTLELYDPDRHATHRFDYGSDPAVLARAHLGWVEWFLGHHEDAIRHSRESVMDARTLDHSYSLCFALAFQGCLAQFSGDYKAALAAAEEMGRLAEAHDYLYWSAWSDILAGWARVRAGQRPEGERLLREGLADYVATGAALLRPYVLYLLADCLPESKDDEALALLDRAIKEAKSQSVLYFHAEMSRYRSERATRILAVKAD
jgi:class 3 adenylate cyclase/predicted ATPase